MIRGRFSGFINGDFVSMTSLAKKTKKKKKQQSPEATPNPSLPYDLLLSCLARVSRLYYPTLSLLSKSCRTLLASPELYKTRSLLNRTVSCLYVCFQCPPDYNQCWVTLSRKPNETLTKIPKKKKKKSRGYVLVPVLVPNSPTEVYKGVVAAGSNIYAIGGTIENAPSSKVSMIGCRSHTWHEAPSMPMDPKGPVTNVVDGKIYVVETVVEDSTSTNWMQVFDPKTQSWELVWSPLDKKFRSIYNSIVIEGDIYLLGAMVWVYKPKEDKWLTIERRDFELGSSWDSYCVIGNVTYCNFGPVIQWYDSKLRSLIELKGVDGLPYISIFSSVTLADCGGKLVVFWDEYVHACGNEEKMIWCAEISLEKRNSEEIWGEVNWVDAVLKVPTELATPPLFPPQNINNGLV